MAKMPNLLSRLFNLLVSNFGAVKQPARLASSSSLCAHGWERVLATLLSVKEQSFAQNWILVGLGASWFLKTKRWNSFTSYRCWVTGRTLILASLLTSL